MAAETRAVNDPEKIHADVLLNAREACYKARDAFYDCIEKQSDKKPTEIGSVGLLYPAECKKSRAEYVKQCRASWVKHFDRLYCRNKTVQRLLDDKDSKRGPMSLPQPYTFKPTKIKWVMELEGCASARLHLQKGLKLDMVRMGMECQKDLPL